MGLIFIFFVCLFFMLSLCGVASLVCGIIFLCLPFRGKNYKRVNGFVENILVPRDGARHYKYVFNYMVNEQICKGYLLLANCKLNRGDKFPLFYNKLNPSQIKSAKKHWVFIVLGIFCILFIPVCLVVLHYVGGFLADLMSYTP